MIRLIASDMDGTLLNAKMGVSEENIAAIRAAEEQGITFMVATGRGATEALPVLEEAGIHCPMITVNGAQVFDREGNILFTIEMEKQLVARIIQVLEKRNIYFELTTTKGVFSNNRMKRMESAAKLLANTIPHLTFKTATSMAATYVNLLNISYVADYQEVMEDEELQILKVITFDEGGKRVLRPAAQEIKPLGPLVITSSHTNNIEITHVEAQKGKAVAHVAKEMGIPMEQVMTIGDNHNDASMLRIAGVSFAMGNAEEEVKDIAKYETGTNLEHGVGKAIQRAITENL